MHLATGRYRLLGWGLILLFSIAALPSAWAAISCGDSNNVCVVTGTNTSDANFIDGNTYVISGTVIFSGAGVDLNIAPGAVIKYTNATNSLLRVTSSATLSAIGTAADTIVFTSCRDQTYGANTSTVSGCTGTLGMQDYNTALDVTASAGDADQNGLAYLKVLYATQGLQLEKDFGFLRDSNFSHFERRASTSALLYFPSSTSIDVYNNVFDVNANATAGGYYGIRLDADFAGDIYDNNFLPERGAYGMYLNTSASLSGNYYDNNVTAFLASGILSASTVASSGDIYTNSFDVNANGTASTYFGVRWNGDYSGDIHDNNAFLTNAAQFVRFQSGAVSGDIYNNDLNLDRSYGIFSNTSSAYSGDVYNNSVDLNSGSSNYAFLYLTGNFSGSVHDNNVILKQTGYGIYNLAGTFSGDILDNNFSLDRAYLVNHVPATAFSGDINGNRLTSFTTITASYGFYLTNAGGTFSGSMCNNTMSATWNMRFINVAAGTFSGDVCNNTWTDINYSAANYLIFNAGTFSGDVHDNNVVDLTQTIANYMVYNSSTFSGDFYNNSIDDVNSTAASYLIHSASGTYSGSIYDNNFSNMVGLAYTIGVAAGTFSGNIYGNRFLDINTTAGYASIYNNGSFTGNISDNNFSRLINHRPFFQNTSGSFSGTFNDNIINDVNFYAANQLIYIAGVSTGDFYNNRITNTHNGVSLYYTNATGTFSGNVYNNLFATNYTATNFIQNASGTFSGSLYNNTFFDFNRVASLAITNSGTFSGNIQRNIFVLGRTGLSGTFTGTVSNNAFQGVTTVGGTASQHEGDQNTTTGFTVNPFLGDGSDRNFLLNTDANGGLLMVGAGGVDVNSFYRARTSLASNKLDAGAVDLGYHYDQNAPYLIVSSPNGGETVGGVVSIDFNYESGYGSTSGLSLDLNYSASPTGGVSIGSGLLSAASCSSGPIFVCSYAWDASDVEDGNYFIILRGSDSNGMGSDVSDANFFLLSSPRVNVKTYSGALPRSFFGWGQDVNIVVDGNAASPHLTIMDSDGNILVNQVAMTDVSTSDVNKHQYTYSVNGSEGWYSIRVSNKWHRNAFYRSPVWQDAYTDSEGNIFPFHFDLNVQEPNTQSRWFWPADVRVDYNYQAAPSSVRVLDFNGTNYLEMPSQVYDSNLSGPSLAQSNLVFFVSSDRNENRSFFVNFSPTDLNADYQADLNLVVSDFNYTFENSLWRGEVDINLGGMISRLWSKLGSNTNLGGNSPMQLSPESRSGIFTYASSSLTNPSYTLDENGGLFSKLNVRGVAGSLDYNLTYYFYAKQPFFVVDSNVAPTQSQTWSYLYDDYLIIADGNFSKFGYYKNNALTQSSVSNGSGSGVSSMGDINYWGAYRPSTGDGIGTVFVERNMTVTPVIDTDFSDDSDYEYWTRQTYSGSVTSSARFNSRIARVVFNAWSDASDLNAAFYGLANPLRFSVGATTANDAQSPIILSQGYTPSDVNDVTDVNVWAVAGDNLQISHADINIIGKDLNIQVRQTFSDANATPNYLVDENILNAGVVDVNIRVFDIASNSVLSTQQFTATDVTAPNVWDFSITPDTNAGIDPGGWVLFDANVTEYTSVSQVNLMLRWYYDANASWSDWNSISMNLAGSPSDYNRNYDLNYFIPSDLNKTFQYYIYTIDSLGNDANSDTSTFYAYTDYTWSFAPSSFGSISGDLDTNVTVGDLNIVNTGDVSLTFSITSNWDPTSKIFFNGTPQGTSYSITVPVDSNGLLATLVNTKSVERSDGLSILADPTHASASPSSATSSGTIISLAGGAFLNVEIQTYPTFVEQGDTNKQFSATITNQGDYDGNSVELTWTLPTGWTITEGDATVSTAILGINSILTNTITVAIADDATAGNQSVIATGTCCDDSNKTRSASESIEVVESDAVVDDSEDDAAPAAGGGGGGGGGGGAGGGGGGGGGSIFKSADEASDFFTSSQETFELLRGQNSFFEVNIKNPFEDQSLQSISIDVDGFLAQYLSVSPTFLGDFSPGEEKRVLVEISSPSYFTNGLHQLTFTINGVLVGKKGSKPLAFQETRTIILHIREVNKAMASKFLNEIKALIQQMKDQEWVVDRVVKLQGRAVDLFDEKRYEEMVPLVEEIRSQHTAANSVSEKLEALKKGILQAKEEGLEIPKTLNLVTLTEQSFNRGEFVKAAERAADAETVFLLETKGAINITAFVTRNWKPLTGVGVAIVGIMFALSLYLRHALLGRKVKLLKAEEGLLLSLIKNAQNDCFVLGKLSINDYHDTVAHFEKRFSRVVEKSIQLETKRANLLKFKTPSAKLRDERDRLIEEIKKTQEGYFNKGDMETHIYDTKMKSLNNRFSQVEKDVMVAEARKAIRMNSGILRPFWKIYYRVIK